jgi:ABC-type Fe3+/spermidine/putrescine transport system ATPase subunit
MSDSIAVMRDGRVEQVGSPAELYDQPRTAFVAGFIGAQNFIPGTVAPGTKRLVSGGELVVEAGRVADGVAAGAQGLAAIRPEHVQLRAHEPAGDSNKVLGSVVAVVMLGDTLEYVLRLADGTELFSRQPRSASDLPPGGAPVWLHWSRERASLFPFDAAVVQGRAFVRAEGGEAAA